MAEPVIEQRPGEDITRALARAHAEAVEDGKSAVLQTTTDGVKVRVFADDNPDDIRGRWVGEMERSGALFTITSETVEARVKAAAKAARGLGCAYVREPDYGIVVSVIVGDSVNSVLRRLNEEFGRLVEEGKIEPKQRRPTGEEVENLRWRREDTRCEHREVVAERVGWLACVATVETEAGAAFVDRRDEDARRLRDLAARLRNAAEATYPAREREALKAAADAERAHIDAMESQSAALFWERS